MISAVAQIKNKIVLVDDHEDLAAITSLLLNFWDLKLPFAMVVDSPFYLSRIYGLAIRF